MRSSLNGSAADDDEDRTASSRKDWSFETVAFFFFLVNSCLARSRKRVMASPCSMKKYCFKDLRVNDQQGLDRRAK